MHVQFFLSHGGLVVVMTMSACLHSWFQLRWFPPVGWQFCFLVKTTGKPLVKISECIFMKFGTDIHGSQRINPNGFRDPLTFYLVPPVGQKLTYPVKYRYIYKMVRPKILVQTFMVPRKQIIIMTLVVNISMLVLTWWYCNINILLKALLFRTDCLSIVLLIIIDV